MKVLTGLSLVLVASAAAVSACGNDFEGCKETRTCPLPEGGAGEGIGGVPGESGGAANEQAGSNGISVGGGGGGAPASSASGASGNGDNSAGASGANAGEPCEPDATQCVGNLLQVCGEDGVWEEPATCPDDAPVCRNGSCKTTPSCLAPQTKCGTNESCCSSPVVEGGSFDRNNDLNYPAQVAGFRLDRFEVTVSRFRKFVYAVDAGYRPAKGAGKHEHLNGGKGLIGGDGVTFESGWLDEWNALLPTTRGEWSEALSCSPSYQTWTILSDNDNLPINCVDWIAAYAFCTWDGGFLPSNTELNYAAAGGKEQRLYAWGDEVPAKDAALAAYGCYFGGGTGDCSGLVNIPKVGSIPAGAGKWGQLDLAGSVFEWSFDWTGEQPATCDNCAVIDTTTAHVRSGGGFASASYWLPTPGPSGFTQSPGKYELGVRCARMP